MIVLIGKGGGNTIFPQNSFDDQQQFVPTDTTDGDFDGIGSLLMMALPLLLRKILE
jgi:hypothetical protein